MKQLILAFMCFVGCAAVAQTENRWKLLESGGISWTPKDRLPHRDHIEMSGKRMSVVFRYGINADGSFQLNKSIVWPMLRTIPNNTHASLTRRFNWDAVKEITSRSFLLSDEHVDSIVLESGVMTVYSTFPSASLTLTREYAPSVEQPALMERYTLKNIDKDESVYLELPSVHVVHQTDASKGVNGAYTLICKTEGAKCVDLKPGEKVSFSASIQAFSTGKGEKELSFSISDELNARHKLADRLQQNLVLQSPDAVINRMFAFSKLRASESIYQTAGGPLHGPGGESYYAAIWANDQAEYANPFFPFVGYDYANASALTSYLMFARFMNDAYKPIPSSIIAEGKDIWNGAGDRGDGAMIAYGASRYALTRASLDEARQLWPLIKWCLEYCNRKLLKEGVVASDSDELEGRFPAGKANLCTSSLYYDALVSAGFLCRELGENSSLAKKYAKQATALRKAINTYFAANVEGFDTYRYYDGNDKLRSWICIPLVMGITERSEGTIKALLSPKLFTENGLLTQSGSTTFWDRSTLYALRGIYAAGQPDKATDFLHYYSNRRLLGDHVPYAIEAWPEGSQRHLSAESALYARIITEGLFGIRPTGFHSFILKPQLPTAWQEASLQHVRAFGSDFTIEVKRTGDKDKLSIKVSGQNINKTYTTRQGQSIEVSLR